MTHAPVAPARDWIEPFVQEHGALLSESQRNRAVVMSFDTLPRATCGALSSEGSKSLLSTTAEAVFWMLAIQSIMGRLDEAGGGEHAPA